MIDPIILHAPHIAGKLSAAERKSRGIQTPAEASAKHDARLERELQQQIANFLRLADIWFDQDSMAHRRRGTKGAPDFLFAYRGIPCAVEAKTQTQVSADQQKAHDAMRKNGWVVIVARSLVEVQGLLQAIDKEQRKL